MSIITADVISKIGYQICPKGNMDALVRNSFEKIIKSVAGYELQAHKMTEDVNMIKIFTDLIKEEEDPKRKEYYFQKIKEFLGDG